MPQPGSLLRGACVAFEKRTSTAWVKRDTKSKGGILKYRQHKEAQPDGKIQIFISREDQLRFGSYSCHTVAAQPLVHVCSPSLLCSPEGIAHGRDTPRGALSRKTAPCAVSSSSSPSPRERDVGPEPCRHQGWVLTTEGF